MPKRYSKIKRTPTFILDFTEVRSYLRRSSPLAFLALPDAMKTILDVIDATPQAWPAKRKRIAGIDLLFHLAVVDIAYRHLHVRYYVDDKGVAHLLNTWVDGHDEPTYVLP